MSSSTVTYTSISSDYKESSDVGSPRVVVYVYDRLPMHLVDPYVKAALQAPKQAPPFPDYVLGPKHLPYPDYEDLADYPADGGDDADDESFDDDNDEDDDDVEEDEEEHLASPDSSAVPTVDPAPIAEYASAPAPQSPPPYLLSPLSSLLPKIPSSPLPLPSPPTTSLTYAIPSPPLLLPSTTHKDDLLNADMPLRKRARFTAPNGRFEVGESSSTAAARQAGHTIAHTVDYGFIDTVDASICGFESKAMTVVGVVNDRVTDLATT
nr:hypothetical protein [Tanacetum cinerariifolium]